MVLMEQVQCAVQGGAVDIFAEIHELGMIDDIGCMQKYPQDVKPRSSNAESMFLQDFSCGVHY